MTTTPDALMADELDPLIERLTDNLGWAERYEIEFAQVAKADLQQALERLEAATSQPMADGVLRAEVTGVCQTVGSGEFRSVTILNKDTGSLKTFVPADASPAPAAPEDDDVTKEAVSYLKNKAAPTMDKGTWKPIDPPAALEIVQPGGPGLGDETGENP